MKKSIIYLIALLSLTACSGGGDNGGNPSGGSEYLNVNNLEIPGGNTTATLIIQASQNCDWTISYDASWIRSVSPRSGRGSQNVTITVTTNPSSTDERTTIINVSNSDGTISRNVTVTQSSDPNAETKTADFQVSPKELTAEAPAGTVPFSIVGDAKWTLSSNTSWATPNVLTGEGNATITVSLKDNTSEEAREATITISSSSKTETVTIRQSAATKPVLSGLLVNNNQKTSADVTFDYTSMFPVTEYGVCYNTTGEPTINDTRKLESGTATQGSPTFSLTSTTSRRVSLPAKTSLNLLSSILSVLSAFALDGVPVAPWTISTR